MDNLTTLERLSYLPTNHYIDGPVSPRTLVDFWETYEKTLERPTVSVSAEELIQ